MPELPEVEIVKRGLDSVLLKGTLSKIDLWSPALRAPIPKELISLLGGRKITATLRRGKYIVVLLEGGNGFGLHLGMSGRVRIYSPKERYTPSKHDHVGFLMKGGARIIYNDARRFGQLFLVRNDSWEQEAPFAGMGPEPLGNGFNAEILAANLASRRTPIKTALLDQRVVAGVGNIYACEALYKAGISPLRSAYSLKTGECEKLARAIKAVLEKAIEQGGSSLRDYRNTKGDLGYFQHHFETYDREGEACPSCDCNVLKTGGVKRIVQAGRSTFYCPRKQI
jgi:formamidopyrimidine-DNA glycosylase